MVGPIKEDANMELPKKCEACEGQVNPLTPKVVEDLLEQLPQWQTNDSHTQIEKTFSFKGYYKTIAFVNAIAWFTQQQNHHPDLIVSYNKCTVKYQTHAINGL